MIMIHCFRLRRRLFGLGMRVASEVEIKAMILNRLLREGKIDSLSLVFNEMSLARKARRVDLGYLSAQEMVAIEVKSEKDTLARLPGQLEVYLRYFDRVILVVASKFVGPVLSTVNHDVEVWEVAGDVVKTVRRGRKVGGIRKDSYLDLMTKREVSLLARKLRIPCDGVPLFDLKNQVLSKIGVISKAKVKGVVVDGLLKRFGMPSRRFLSKVIPVQYVSVMDVGLLSPYSVLRLCTKSPEPDLKDLKSDQ